MEAPRSTLRSSSAIGPGPSLPVSVMTSQSSRSCDYCGDLIAVAAVGLVTDQYWSLRKFLMVTFDLGRKRQVADSLRALMAEAQIDLAFGERFRASFSNAAETHQDRP
jgi:hypothetical protein